MFSNDRSVRNKLPYLELIISSNICDIVCLVETLLTKNDSDSLLIYGNFNYIIFRYDINSHYGGVAIICKKYLYPRRLNLNEFIDIEQITLLLQSLEIKLTYIYRPLSINSNGHNSICKLISNICDSINPTIIVGDFNLPLCNWNDNSFPNYPSYYSLFYIIYFYLFIIIP